ncbi:MAG: hypothetical protein NT135_01025 [Candidatus Berkelbacteria bacterium]|nr:hypothetical protein [Candidatus Berkelbacteria bacterium]
MKTLLVASIVIAGIIAINELDWLGKTSLAWPILGLAVSIILIAVYLLNFKEK